MPAFDDTSRALLDKPNFAHVSTLREDGTVQNVVVWLGLDGDDVILNSAEGRAWPANLARDPRVTISVHDQEKPYEYVAIRGTVTDTSTEGADAVIDGLAKKYMGVDSYPFRQEGETRVTFRITPEKVTHFGA